MTHESQFNLKAVFVLVATCAVCCALAARQEPHSYDYDSDKMLTDELESLEFDGFENSTAPNSSGQ